MNRERSFVECSIDEYDSAGGFASTTICIETGASDAGSSRRSSKKSTSTRRRRRRKRSQLWLSSADDDFSVATALRAATGKVRCVTKTPFATGGPGRPYNKKLSKKTFQGHGQQNLQQRSEFSAAAAVAPLNGVALQETLGTANAIGSSSSSSSFFISETHRAVAEATTPWSHSPSGGPARYQFLGQGGLTAKGARQWKKGTGRCGGHSNGNAEGHRNKNDDEDDDADWPEFLDIAAMGGGSRRLEPLGSPSILPPSYILPASSTDISSDALERCFLEATLDDNDSFSLL